MTRCLKSGACPIVAKQHKIPKFSYGGSVSKVFYDAGNS